jgi:flagellar hook-basal body complex protein FliE
MEQFINRGRAGSPQNARPGTSARRLAVAANAKASMKEASAFQKPQAHSAIPTRGLSAQNVSATMQRYPQRRQSDQDQVQKRDPYDTDAESLDTTVNQSVVQVEDSQNRNQQHSHHSQLGQPGQPGDELTDDEEGPEEKEDENMFEDDELASEDLQRLEQQDLLDLSHDERVAFLQQSQSHGFPMVEGDSYPSTTDGLPTEWEGGEEQLFEDRDDHGGVSPLPQRTAPTSHSFRTSAPQPYQRTQQPIMRPATHGVQKPSVLEKSANIRGQQRSTAQYNQHLQQGHQQNGAALPSSQPPTYSQANPGPGSAPPLYPSVRQLAQVQFGSTSQRTQRQPLGPAHVHFQSSTSVGPAVPTRHPVPAPSREEPAVQQTQESDSAIPIVDYDPETLFAMKYDQLKEENFDIDPRAGPQILTDDILQKPLAERLQFVRKNIEPSRQSEFFHSLSTTDWEDSGNWFLEQFQGIVQRTREARQKKRKLAREFEEEIEKRHKHVSKKQQQVEEAMNKMKAQGEGLVPKSPKPTRSPRPKRA